MAIGLVLLFLLLIVVVVMVMVVRKTKKRLGAYGVENKGFKEDETKKAAMELK